MQKLHQNTTNSRLPGYRTTQTSSSSFVAAVQVSHGKGSESDRRSKTVEAQLQLTDFESVSASVTSDADSQTFTESTRSAPASILCHPKAIRGEMLTRYICQSESEEPVVVFVRTLYSRELQASATPRASQNSKPNDEIVLAHALHLDASIQPTGGFPGEMLSHYLHQCVKDEPVYVYADSGVAGEASSLKRV